MLARSKDGQLSKIRVCQMTSLISQKMDKVKLTVIYIRGRKPAARGAVLCGPQHDENQVSM